VYVFTSQRAAAKARASDTSGMTIAAWETARYLSCLNTYAMKIPSNVATRDTAKATTTLLRTACQACSQRKSASYHLKVKPPHT
jgi:hypothetical protein